MTALPNSGPELLVDVLFVESEPVEHADQEAILLLSVVLAFVGAVGDPQLVERCPIARHLRAEGTHQSGCKNTPHLEHARTLASSAFLMDARRWILASPRSICAMMRSMSCNS